MIQLHYFPGNASLAPHMLLEELGVPFELKLVDRAQDAQKSPEYLKRNPNGTIPAELFLETRGADGRAPCCSGSTAGRALLRSRGGPEPASC